MAKKPEILLLRILAKVKQDKRTGCWIWQAAITRWGYGHIGLPGGIVARAHRVTYELWKGPIPPGKELDHLCRNRACVNPAHLEPVTRRENLMRGLSPSALHAKKTHCPKGHPYAGHNLYRTPSTGGRLCRACMHLRYLEKKHASHS